MVFVSVVLTLEAGIVQTGLSAAVGTCWVRMTGREHLSVASTEDPRFPFIDGDYLKCCL